jgi:hypothetical protein
MPVHRVQLGIEGVHSYAAIVWPDSNPDNRIIVTFAELISLTPAGNEAILVDKLQEGLDTRQQLNAVTLADPDKTVNPNLDNSFWGNEDGSPSLTGNYLIGRGVEVVAASWNAALGKYIVELRATTQEARS